VVAVEPVAAMRDVLARAVPSVRVLDGTAEGLPLADQSADALVVGQAFHWFDADRALAEFHRVLRPEGRLGLIWNRRRLEQPLQRAISEIIEPYRGETPQYGGRDWRRALEQGHLFEQMDEVAIPFEQVLDVDGLVDRVGSTSFIAALDAAPREEVLGRIRRLAGDDLEPLSYVSDAFVFRRLSLM
jgi:SAM-dependent methyltransferase